jgi:hypothetical protein
MDEKVEREIASLIALQKKKLMNFANQLLPHITEEDILQPNDFPILENHPYFRHEEGVLEGLQTALAAVRAIQRQS